MGIFQYMGVFDKEVYETNKEDFSNYPKSHIREQEDGYLVDTKTNIGMLNVPFKYKYRFMNVEPAVAVIDYETADGTIGYITREDKPDKVVPVTSERVLAYFGDMIILTPIELFVEWFDCVYTSKDYVKDSNINFNHIALSERNITDEDLWAFIIEVYEKTGLTYSEDYLTLVKGFSYTSWSLNMPISTNKYSYFKGPRNWFTFKGAEKITVFNTEEEMLSYLNLLEV